MGSRARRPGLSRSSTGGAQSAAYVGVFDRLTDQRRAGAEVDPRRRRPCDDADDGPSRRSARPWPGRTGGRRLRRPRADDAALRTGPSGRLQRTLGVITTTGAASDRRRRSSDRPERSRTVPATDGRARRRGSRSSAAATSARCTPPAMASLGHDVVGVDVDAAKVRRARRGPGAVLRARARPSCWPRGRGAAGCGSPPTWPTRPAATVHFVCVGTPQKRGRERRRPAPRRRRGRRAAAAPEARRPRRRQVDRAGRHRRAAARSRCRRPSRRRRWSGTRSSCARATPCATPSPPTGWSTACPTARPGSGPSTVLNQVYAKALADGTPLVVTDYTDRPAGQGRGELVPGHQDLLHQRDGRAVRGHRRRRRRSWPTRSATTPGSAAGSSNAGLGFGGGCLPKDIRAFMARAGELGVDQALTLPARGRRDQPAPPGRGWSTWPARSAAARSSAAGSPCSERRSSPTATTCGTRPPSTWPRRCRSRAPTWWSPTRRRWPTRRPSGPDLNFADDGRGGRARAPSWCCC